MSRMAQRLRGGSAESAHDPAHRGITRGILGQNREVYSSIVSQASNLCVHSDASNDAPSHCCALLAPMATPPSTPTTTISASSSTTVSFSTFQSIFHARLEGVQKKDRTRLRTHPFRSRAGSPDARKSEQTLIKGLNPTALPVSPSMNILSRSHSLQQRPYLSGSASSSTPISDCAVMSAPWRIRNCASSV